MKKILITGANSYIGCAVESWLGQQPEAYRVSTLDLKREDWRDFDFSLYDVVFHVAGIAHVSFARKNEDHYFKINRDLAIETAQLAKRHGVQHFIFMSSAIVFGDSAPVGHIKIITKDTIPKPTNAYGKSKLEAETGLLKLDDEQFRVAILRPPMIYGKGSKGNYPLLAKAAKRLPFFPQIANQRSMLHIDNLCEFIRQVIDHAASGIFFPQNQDYVQTSDLVYKIAQNTGNRIYLTKIFNPLIRILPFPIFRKVFGSFVYEHSLSLYTEMPYQLVDLDLSIRKTEQSGCS